MLLTSSVLRHLLLAWWLYNLLVSLLSSMLVYCPTLSSKYGRALFLSPEPSSFLHRFSLQVISSSFMILNTLYMLYTLKTPIIISLTPDISIWMSDKHLKLKIVFGFPLVQWKVNSASSNCPNSAHSKGLQPWLFIGFWEITFEALKYSA